VGNYFETFTTLEIATLDFDIIKPGHAHKYILTHNTQTPDVLDMRHTPISDTV